MRPSRTLALGFHGPQEALAVAYGAHDHDAEIISRGAIGTRPCDIAQLIRTRPSKATQLLFVYEAGPWGAWLDRSLRPTGDDGWGGRRRCCPNDRGSPRGRWPHGGR